MSVFKNGKKSIWGFFKIVTLSITITCLSACTQSPSSIIPSGSRIEWTKDDLSEAFWEYKDELNEVAEIVLASESLRQSMIGNDASEDYKDYNTNFGYIASEANKDYFSEEDWGKIVDLFKKIRPLEIVRSLRHGDVVWIDFIGRKVDDGYLRTSLYYFRKPKTVDVYNSYIFSIGVELEHLDGYWYIKTSPLKPPWRSLRQKEWLFEQWPWLLDVF